MKLSRCRSAPLYPTETSLSCLRYISIALPLPSLEHLFAALRNHSGISVGWLHRFSSHTHAVAVGMLIVRCSVQKRIGYKKVKLISSTGIESNRFVVEDGTCRIGAARISTWAQDLNAQCRAISSRYACNAEQLYNHYPWKTIGATVANVTTVQPSFYDQSFYS